jgi:hypothetical protein
MSEKDFKTKHDLLLIICLHSQKSQQFLFLSSTVITTVPFDIFFIFPSVRGAFSTFASLFRQEQKEVTHTRVEEKEKFSLPRSVYMLVQYDMRRRFSL